MAPKKVVPMKRRFRPNIAAFIIVLIVVYIIFLTWGYLTKKHISIYEVNTTKISDDTPMYGFILRKEKVYYAKKDGYINYYNAEGSRVGVGDVIYTLDTSGVVKDRIADLQTSNASEDDITLMREVISTFQRSFSLSDYSRIANLKSDARNVLFDQNNENLYKALKKSLKESGQEGDYSSYKATKTGVIAYSTDGYETMTQSDITAEIMEQYEQPLRNPIQTDEMLKEGDPAYRLVTDNTWQLIVRLNDEYYEKLQTLESDTIRVNIKKDALSFNAAMELWEQEGIPYVGLSTSRYMEHYINDRFLELEFQLKSAEGLKIPNSAILQKTLESGETVDGVYCVNQGYCEFRPIEILYQNKEYTIVSDTTEGGLADYDHIVVDPSSLSEDDFIK